MQHGLNNTYSFSVLFVITAWLSWGIQRIENRRRDKLALTDPATYGYGDANPDPTSGLRDLTDRENLVSKDRQLSLVSH